MRYTEKENFENEKGILQKILCAVTAPVRLCRELSTKFIFLKRSLIEKVLIIAVLFALSGILIDLCIAKLTGTIHWFDGRFPFICRVIGFGVIVILYLFYELHEFSIYKQIDKLVMNHVMHKENVKDSGIAPELLFSEDNELVKKDNREHKDIEINLSLLDSGADEQTISIDPSLFGDDNSISLDEMFDNLEFEQKTKLNQNINLSEKNFEEGFVKETETPPDDLNQPMTTEEVFTQATSMSINIPNGQEVVDYQMELQNCINNLISSGIEYVGTLSEEDINEIEEDIKNADSFEEAQFDMEIAKKGISFEYEKDLEILNIQKSWNVPEVLKEVI